MRTRQVLAGGVLTLVCFVAAAPIVSAEPAHEPVVASSCLALVDGEPGQQVVLDPRSLIEPVVAALTPLDPLGVLVGPLGGVLSAMDPIPVGVVPDGQAEIPGSQVADAVVARLSGNPLLAPVLGTLVPVVTDTLGTLCGLLVRADQPSAPPADTTPGGPGVPGVPSEPSASELFAMRPRVVTASNGRGAVFGARLSGLAAPAAAFGSLNAGGVPGAGTDASVSGSQPAGRALPAPGAGSSRRQLYIPILVAILLLTIISARLVHRWASGTRHQVD